MLLGPRITHVFRSRRHALLWAVSVLITAYCTVPRAQEGDQQDPPPPSQQQQHVNPWAKNPG